MNDMQGMRAGPPALRFLGELLATTNNQLT